MKRSYLNELYTYLKKQKVVQADINKVLDDYEMLFDEAKDAGLSDEEVIQRLGSAESIYHNMKGDLNHYENKWNKLVAISPFVALI
ncbi:MAG TPA: DUF1700 domain-containing protein, partial [Acholeplasma sp.]|nr:DUF1700 domain-containing protein [Acholeplasma sp.]